MQGTAYLYDVSGLSVTGDWDDCAGLNGADQFRAGAEMEVTDEAGKHLAYLALRHVDEADAAWLAKNELTNDSPFYVISDTSQDPKEFIDALQTGSLSPPKGCLLVFEGDVASSSTYIFALGELGQAGYTDDTLREHGYFVNLGVFP